MNDSLETIAGRLRAGTLQAEALIQQAIDAHEAQDLGAYKSWDGARALEQARAADILLAQGRDLGPLMGIPVSVKDLFAVPGLPLYAGTNAAFPDDWMAPGPLVRRLLRQLALVTGKTHTVEFAFGGLGVNAHWGTPINPWSGTDGARVPGGSSSGAAVSLAEGSALLALGTDTAGSVRLPASFCGQAGLKTTAGRWDPAGIVPLSHSLDTAGLLARCVADLAWGFAALDPRQPGVVPARPLAGLRIGVPSHFFWDDGDAAVLTRIEACLADLERGGAVLVSVTLPGCDAAFDIFRQGGLAAPELRAWIDRNCPERMSQLDPVVRLRVEGADRLSAPDYLHRRDDLRQLGQDARSVFDQCDLLACPTVAIPPPLLSEIESAEDYARINMMALRNTVIANLYGWCALTLPAGPDTSGLPTGLQLIAPPMAEITLLGAGRTIEERMGTGATLQESPKI